METSSSRMVSKDCARRAGYRVGLPVKDQLSGQRMDCVHLAAPGLLDIVARSRR